MADNTVRVEGNYSAKWVSMHNALLKNKYLGEIYKTYGRGFDIMDLATLATKKGTVGTRTLRFFEQNHWKATATTSTAIVTGSAGADISFKIAAGDYDTNGNPTLRIGATVFIPQAYQTTLKYPAGYRVMSKSGTAGDYTFVAKPFKSTAQIGVEVPIGTKLTIGMLQFAPGTGLPEGTTQSYFERSYGTTILKSSFGIEGGFLSEQYWEPLEAAGISGYYNKQLNGLEIDLNDQENSYIWMGQPNEVASLTQDSYFGGTNKVLSSYGLWPVMDAMAQQLWYTDAIASSDYTTAKNLFESQGVFDQDVVFAMGSSLYDQTDVLDENYVKEFSGGTDLLKNMNELGFQAQTVFRNGVRFHKIKLYSLSNPFSFGNEEYGLSDCGFMMPTTKSKVMMDMEGKKSVTLSNVELRYLAKGAENRTRVIAPLNGISGISGAPAVNEYDGMKYGIMSEPLVLYTNVNQMVQIRKE